MQESCYLRGVRGLAPASSAASRMHSRTGGAHTRRGTHKAGHTQGGAHTRRGTQKAVDSIAGVLLFKGGAGAGPRVERSEPYA